MRGRSVGVVVVALALGACAKDNPLYGLTDGAGGTSESGTSAGPMTSASASTTSQTGSTTTSTTSSTTDATSASSGISGLSTGEACWAVDDAGDNMMSGAVMLPGPTCNGGPGFNMGGVLETLDDVDWYTFTAICADGEPPQFRFSTQDAVDYCAVVECSVGNIDLVCVSGTQLPGADPGCCAESGVDLVMTVTCDPDDNNLVANAWVRVDTPAEACLEYGVGAEIIQMGA